jgi:hypothetical protein
MSNDVTTPDGGAPTGTPTRGRRKLWVAAGVAGLTGVVGLAALGGLAARDDKSGNPERLSDAQASTPKQNVSDAGKADTGSGEEDGRKDGQDQGGQDWHGKDWQGKDGKDWQGKKDKDGKDRKDNDKDAKELPCDTDVLVEAVNRANEDTGGVFKLARDCTYRFTEQTDNNAFPVIDERITILGNNSTFFHDGSELFRFFEVASGGELTLKDLTLKGGQVTAPPQLPTRANGGALLIQEGGEAILKHTKLVDNRATGTGNGGNGGAIYNLGEVEIHDSTLTDNHARGNGENGGNGGAIYNEGELTVHDSRIDNNTATGTGNSGGDGGGIANRDNGTATIAYSQITNNKASNDGGGIHSDDDARLEVTRTKIAGNTACDSGGGIWNGGDSTMLLEYVIIADNKATDDGGGVFHDSDSIATIKHTVFVNNTAGDNGGGLFNGETVNLYDSEFKGNHAEQGGAIYNDTTAVLTIRNSKIVENFASETAGAGGIFNSNNATVNLDTKTIIKKNEPRNCTNVPGCAN